jgi:hypothetical protein
LLELRFGLRLNQELGHLARSFASRSIEHLSNRFADGLAGPDALSPTCNLELPLFGEIGDRFLGSDRVDDDSSIFYRRERGVEQPSWKHAACSAVPNKL